MNPEILKLRRQIKAKLFKGHPEKYPDYCRRLGLDMLNLLDLIIDELYDKDQGIENINYAILQEAQPR